MSLTYPHFINPSEINPVDGMESGRKGKKTKNLNVKNTSAAANPSENVQTTVWVETSTLRWEETTQIATV